MDFPSQPPRAIDPPHDLVNALNVEASYVGQSRLNYLVQVDKETTLRTVNPDFKRLSQLPGGNVIVTAKADGDEYDFVSRFFAPASGVDEDPVTGSAHCVLGPFWQSQLKQDAFTAFQASRRGGIVHLTVKGDRVLLGGNAITVLRCELLI